jgi:hypothetical protein
MLYDGWWNVAVLASEPCSWRIRGAAVVLPHSRIVGGCVWVSARPNSLTGLCLSCVRACEPPGRLAGWLAGVDGGLQRSLSNLLVLGWVSFCRIEWVWTLAEGRERREAFQKQRSDHLLGKPSFPSPSLSSFFLLSHKSPPHLFNPINISESSQPQPLSPPPIIVFFCVPVRHCFKICTRTPI